MPEEVLQYMLMLQLKVFREGFLGQAGMSGTSSGHGVERVWKG